MKSVLVAAAALVLLQDPEPPSWEDRDFSGSGFAAKRVGTAGGAALLSGEYGRLGGAQDLSEHDVVADFVVFRGRLLAAVCFQLGGTGPTAHSGYSSGTDICEFDPVAGAWKLLKRVDGAMILNLRVAGDRLFYACFSGATSTVGTWDGKTWGELGKIPEVMIHGMDVAVHEGKTWWAGSWRPTTREEIMKDPRAAAGVGRIFVTADDGRTWTESFRDVEAGRIQDLVVFKDALYANRRGEDLIRWTGKEWVKVPVDLPTKKGERAFVGDSQLLAFKGSLLAVNPVCVYRYDGRAWTSSAPGYLKAWSDGTTVHALQDDGHVYASADGKSWKKETDVAVPKVLFSRKAALGWTIRRGSVIVHGGRLFVGAGSEGKCYASEAHLAGTLLSPPRKVAGGTQLAWDARRGAGQKLTLAVRTASTAEGLADAPWGIEAAEPPLKPGAPRSHEWIQYRATFASDGKGSPVLDAVRWIP